MRDVKEMAEIGQKMPEILKKQDIIAGQIKAKMERQKQDPNSRRAGEIKQKARELEKINKEVERLHGDFKSASR